MNALPGLASQRSIKGSSFGLNLDRWTGVSCFAGTYPFTDDESRERTPLRSPLIPVSLGRSSKIEERHR